MKTTILIILICSNSLFSNKIAAQEKGEFKLSYGYSGVDFFIPQSLQTFSAFTCGIANTVSTVGGLLGSTNPVSIPCRFQMRGSGTYSISYNHILNEKVSVGGQLNYSSYKYRWRSDKPWKKTDIISPYAKVEYRHSTKPNHEFYSGFMLGILSAKDGLDRNGIPAFHLTALGFRHGIKNAVFCEFGLGLK